MGKSAPTRLAGVVLSSAVDQSTGYWLAVRGSQGGFGTPKDRSYRANDAAVNAALIPPAWTAGAVIATNAYVTPGTLSGLIYKATTGGTTGGSQPTLPPTVGNTVVDNTVTWTCEKGPWFTAAAGAVHLRSIASAQVGADGAWSFPAIDWNLVAGDSLIVSVRGQFDFTAGNELQIFGNGELSASAGFFLLATTAPFKDLRFGVRAASGTEVISGHTSGAFGRRPLDGQPRTTTFMLDGFSKILYAFADGIAYQQSDMFNSSNLSPNGLSFATITTSTTTANRLDFGGAPNSATSYEVGASGIDVVVLKGASLPANIQGIADWFHQRGEGLIPAYML